MVFATEAPKDSAVDDVPDLASSVNLAKASMPLVWHVFVGGGGRKGRLMSVPLLALRLVRVVPAIVRSVATWFEVGDRICGRDM